MKVARTVLNGESGSNAADLHNIIVENGIKSILQKIFDYYYSYKRTCKTVALGELIGINDLKRDATIARNSAGANDSYYYNIIPSNVVKCSYLVEILEDRSQPKIYIVSKYYSNYKNDYNVKGVVVGSSMLSVKFFYNDNGDIILSIVASTRSSLVSVKLLCGDSMPSITKIETPSGLTEIPIS